MKLILFKALCLLYTIVAIQAEQERLGNGSILTRIIGGQKAINIEKYPYQISMRVAYPSGQTAHFCGGSIISEQHIVTAAHCVKDKQGPEWQASLRIYTGTSKSNSGGTGHRVKSVTMHPGYTASPNYFNDIAVVTLSDPIVYNAKQKPIDLPTQDVVNGAAATITGWGFTSVQNKETPEDLKEATMQLITSSQCQNQLPYQLRNTQVCAFRGYGVGVCTGDSGGPLVSNGQLVGVASYVDKCGGGRPDVYTNVYSFVNFIRQVMNSKEGSVPPVNPFDDKYLTGEINNLESQYPSQQFNPFGGQHFNQLFNQFGSQHMNRPFNPFSQPFLHYRK